MFLCGIKGDLIVVAPYVNEVLTMLELLVYVGIVGVAWELLFCCEVIGKKGFSEGGFLDRSGNVGKKTIPGWRT